MKRTLLSILLAAATLGALAGTPSWVSTKPHVSGYYTGVGSAPSGAPDSADKARTAALADLISEISLSVTADMRQSAAQHNDDYDELFTYDVKTHSDAYLEGHELVDSYDDGTDLWVYYRLSHKKYEEVLARRMKEAASRAYECDRRGNDAARSGNFSGALALYAEGLEAAAPFAARNLAHDGVNVTAQLQQDLTALLSGITLDVTPSQADVAPLSHDAVEVTARLHSGSTPLAGCPVGVSFTEGSGSLSTPPVTSAEGTTRFSVTDVTSRDPAQSVLVTADLSPIVSRYDGTAAGVLLRRCMPQNPQGVLRLKVSAPSLTAFCRYAKACDDEGVLRAVSSYLSTYYFDMAPDEASADVVVDVTVDYRPGGTVKGELYDMTEGFISCRVELQDRATGNVAATMNVDDVRALVKAGESASKLRKQAQRELLRKLKPELKRRMKTTRFARRSSREEEE